MKKQILPLILALSGLTSTAMADGVFTITGTGSGTLNGVEFTDSSFQWTMDITTNRYTGWGPSQPIYAWTLSEITLSGVASPINVTQDAGLFAWLDTPDNSFFVAPIRMNGSTPLSNILTLSGTPDWDGVLSFTSTSMTTMSFNQFSGLQTDQGALSMPSGTITSVSFAGTPVPEPSALALSVLGGLGLLICRRRR